MGEKLWDVELGQKFIVLIPKVWSIREKIDNNWLGLMMKRNTKGWKKMFVNYIFKKFWYLEYTKNSQNSKNVYTIRKWGKHMKDILPKKIDGKQTHKKIFIIASHLEESN